MRAEAAIRVESVEIETYGAESEAVGALQVRKIGELGVIRA